MDITDGYEMIEHGPTAVLTQTQYPDLILSCLAAQPDPIPISDLAEIMSLQLLPSGDTRQGARVEHLERQLRYRFIPELRQAGLVWQSPTTKFVALDRKGPDRR